MNIKKNLIKAHWLLSRQFGFDPRIFLRSVRGLPRYMHDFIAFRKQFTGKMTLTPCLHDRYEEGGATKSEYFWQDLLVARAIHEACPIKHVDIGSRVDGFVAHVASFRECEVFDVRPISAIVPGVVFRQADLMDSTTLPKADGVGYCDSLSCLHAIEHFGLGRYGDSLNPNGYRHGIANMAKLLFSGGTFYLSTPIGEERVDFNANWVFDPRSIVSCCENAGLLLRELILITAVDYIKLTNISPETLAALALNRYQLAVFVFRKS